MQRSISEQADVDLAVYKRLFPPSDDSLSRDLVTLARQGSKTTLIASLLEGVGKSTVASHIATSLALRGLKVLLLEADMRSPRLGASFGVTNYDGLASLLINNDSDISSYIEKTAVPNLSILVGGALQPKSHKLLLTERFDEILSRLERQYHSIIIDSPPLRHYKDARVLANKTNNTLIVVQKDRVGTYNNVISRAVGDAKKQIIGSVVIDKYAQRWDYVPVPKEVTSWNQ